jgi:phosphoribosylformylglycinamidine cyclo-ligase
MTEHTYKAAGVDIDAADRFTNKLKAIVSPTHGPEVLGGVGAFGAMYQLNGYREPVLVSSTDGVGTKLRLAQLMGRYDTIGEDLVNACVNDVIVSGARPLFFLDYIAVGKLDPDALEPVVQGMARACEESGCALIGGETAEMPGLYDEGELDMAGFAVGVVEKSDILGASRVEEGNLLIGVPSNGLHTNGYSLVRHALGLDVDPSPLSEHYSALGGTLGEALLKPHRSYTETLRPVRTLVNAVAHVTGGGLPGNVPRVLPDGLAARFDTSAWQVPLVFTVLQEITNVSSEEMYRVFNMGLGMVVVCDETQAGELVATVPEAGVVGKVVPATDDRRVII